MALTKARLLKHGFPVHGLRFLEEFRVICWFRTVCTILRVDSIFCNFVMQTCRPKAIGASNLEVLRHVQELRPGEHVIEVIPQTPYVQTCESLQVILER